ncbi:hypothetical protein HU755_04435 [Pseudomonas sp. SWRI111]|uniref:hypothetical protein n=1 Tax=Pseudomonas sp. SWRI111 TaxID=2745507 RepID=UPI00164468DB|nr:hypothetical protein [Pseudomonas sp. SWRI111]MBC3206022.1 hypothetical protein [Pseudomonas sp. SWRI111]
MGELNSSQYTKEFFEGIKKASEGQLKVKVGGVAQTFPVSRAEVRANDIVMEFDMSGGNPDFNRMIYIVIKKSELSRKVVFTAPGEPVYFLFQNATQEWLAASGWISVEWQEGSKKIEGLLDDIQGERDEGSKLASGEFWVTLS